MTEQDRDERQSGGEGATRGGAPAATGDPGRTPGKAEGDERTVEEDLRRQGGGQPSS
ncbi:MAG: hypothetical protein ABR563_06150 [Pyrinomonadaceae bacterium]